MVFFNFFHALSVYLNFSVKFGFFKLHTSYIIQYLQFHPRSHTQSYFYPHLYSILIAILFHLYPHFIPFLSPFLILYQNHTYARVLFRNLYNLSISVVFSIFHFLFFIFFVYICVYFGRAQVTTTDVRNFPGKTKNISLDN